MLIFSLQSGNRPEGNMVWKIGSLIRQTGIVPERHNSLLADRVRIRIAPGHTLRNGEYYERIQI